MSFLPNNNTAFKRHLIKEEDPVEEEEEDDCLFENQESENLSEIQPASVTAPPKEAPKKARRGRPPKRNATATRSVAESSGSSASASTLASPLTNLPEFDLVLKAMSLKVRPSTAAAYRKPLEEWQDFCRENRHRYPVDPRFPLTVGPTEFVLAFFKESVLKRTYKKSISMETDVRTQIALRNDENENSELTLLEIAENAPSNKHGSKKIIDVPLGVEAVNQYKKALIVVFDYQFEHRAIPWVSPKKNKELLDLIKKYEHDLVYDQVQTNADRAAHCVIRDSYKSGELIRMLKNLWVSNSETGLREMFSISSRHHMLLRDQDLRHLNFADCFCTIVPKKQHNGMQQAICLVFSLDKGKTLKEGEVKFACAMRHENVFRCPFGAFAFFMFSLHQNNGDFLKEDRWHKWKVLRGRGSPEKSLSGATQWKTTKKALTGEAVFTTRVTHGGRHAGAMEAEGLGIPFDLIKQGGGWKDRLGRLETHYLDKLPSSFARELQRMVFRWIESYFGEGNVEWEAVCEKEMKEIDENEDEDDNILNLDVENEADPIEFVEEDEKMILK